MTSGKTDRVRLIQVRPGRISDLREIVRSKFNLAGDISMTCRDAEIDDDQDTVELRNEDNIIVKQTNPRKRAAPSS